MPESNPVQLLQTVYPSELLGFSKLFEEALKVIIAFLVMYVCPYVSVLKCSIITTFGMKT